MIPGESASFRMSGIGNDLTRGRPYLRNGLASYLSVTTAFVLTAPHPVPAWRCGRNRHNYRTCSLPFPPNVVAEVEESDQPHMDLLRGLAKRGPSSPGSATAAEVDSPVEELSPEERLLQLNQESVRETCVRHGVCRLQHRSVLQTQ